MGQFADLLFGGFTFGRITRYNGRQIAFRMTYSPKWYTGTVQKDAGGVLVTGLDYHIAFDDITTFVILPDGDV